LRKGEGHPQCFFPEKKGELEKKVERRHLAEEERGLKNSYEGKLSFSYKSGRKKMPSPFTDVSFRRGGLPLGGGEGISGRSGGGRGFRSRRGGGGAAGLPEPSP